MYIELLTRIRALDELLIECGLERGSVEITLPARSFMAVRDRLMSTAHVGQQFKFGQTKSMGGLTPMVLGGVVIRPRSQNYEKPVLQITGVKYEWRDQPRA